ncbi:MAG: hypothetical protein WBA88_15910 [Pseudaminobacter sp.]
MTVEANGLPATGTTAPATTAITDPGSPGDGKTWAAGLQAEENRALVEAKQWATPDDAIRSYRELETHASKALRLPGENATADDWNAFYQKLGRPDKPDGYELKLNTELVPQDFPYDETSAVEYRTWAHEAGLTPKQAQALHDKFVGHQAAQLTAMKEQAAKRESDAHRQIVQEWGDPDTSTYKQNIELASRAISHLGLKDALVEGGALSADGAIRHPAIAKAMAKIGKELYAEDSMATNANGVLANPFSDGSNFNLTKQGELIRSDPRKAAALIRAAGKKVADYGLS